MVLRPSLQKNNTEKKKTVRKGIKNKAPHSKINNRIRTRTVTRQKQRPDAALALTLVSQAYLYIFLLTTLHTMCDLQLTIVDQLSQQCGALDGSAGVPKYHPFPNVYQYRVA